MGECIQGLLLLANQQLLFAELGGFVNNAFFMSPSMRLLASFPSQFSFVLFFFLDGVFMDRGYQARYWVSTSMWFYTACGQVN